MGAVRKLSGAKEAKWAGRDVQKAGQKAVAEYERAYKDVAPGIAQFMMPQHAAGFGYTSRQPYGGFGETAPDYQGSLLDQLLVETGQTPSDQYVPPQGQTAIPTPTGGMTPADGTAPMGLQSMDALNRLRAAQGLYGPEMQQQFYDEFVSSPGTQFLREEGIRDINRQMQARGGLGGGSRLKAITEFSQNLANQQVGNYMQGLGSLAQTDLSLAGQMAGLRTGLGSNIATGLTDAAIGAADARVAGGAATGQLLGGLATAAGGAMSMMSDRRLKDNLHLVGIHDGIKWYQWDWNEKAREIGWHTMPRFGVIAQELMQTHPDCVEMDEQTGYFKVNYGRLFNILNLQDEVA